MNTAKIIEILETATSLLSAAPPIVAAITGVIALFKTEDPKKVWTQAQIDAKINEFTERQDDLDEKFGDPGPGGEDEEDE